MKKTIAIAGIVFTFIACNQSEQQGTGNNASDTASHSAHDGNGTGTGTTGNNQSGTASNRSMMSIMETNMDQMKEVESLGSNDKDFAAMMKIHHMGATEMAQLQLAQGTDPQLKSMAQRMIDEQQREMQQLDAFLSNNNNQNSAASDKSSPFYDRVMKEMDNMKMDDMNHSGVADLQFVQLMIPHHQGGIAMADLYLKNGAKDQNLKAIANKIKTDQQKEIQQMQAWQASRNKSQQ
jgi:uncharacterized protein (DUF305 family)